MVARAPRLSLDLRRRRLLDLGLRLFSEHRYDDVTTDAIAAAAGVSKGLVYHYFQGKRGYYVAVIEELGRRLLDAIPPDDDAPIVDVIRRALFRGVDAARQNAAAYRALTRGGVGHDPEVARIIDDVRTAAIARLVRRAGGFGSSPHARTAWAGWIGACEATILHWLDHGCDLPEEHLVDLMLGSAIGVLSAPSRATTLPH